MASNSVKLAAQAACNAAWQSAAKPQPIMRWVIRWAKSVREEVASRGADLPTANSFSCACNFASAAALATPPWSCVGTEGVALGGATKLGAADLRADGGVECDATSVLATCSDAPRGVSPSVISSRLDVVDLTYSGPTRPGPSTDSVILL
jgi:hypothetical protein